MDLVIKSHILCRRLASNFWTTFFMHPMGDATCCIPGCTGLSVFLLTHPMGDATENVIQQGLSIINFYSRIPWGMRHLFPESVFVLWVISTHASHGGCDFQSVSGITPRRISTHASHGGCDLSDLFGKIPALSFLLTHPMGDATNVAASFCAISGFLLTHPMGDATRSVHHGL